MVSNWRSKSAVAGSTFLMWALAAGSAVAWGLRFSAQPAVLPQAAAVATPPPVDPSTIASLLGSQPSAGPAAAPPLASRFSLQGVVADGGHGGAALLAIDGKPPKPFRVGAQVDEGLQLQSVEPRRALIGPPGGAPVVVLELPRPAGGGAAAPGPAGIGAPPGAINAPPAPAPGAPAFAPAMPPSQAPMAAPR